MKDIIKGLWKWILAILIILVLGGAILAFRIFVIDKDFDGSSSSLSKKKNDKSVTDTVTDTVNSDGINDGYGSDGKDGEDGTSSSGSLRNSASSLGQKVINGAKSIGNSTVKGYKEDEEIYDYNAHNFDEWFLMYEGEQYDGAVKNILEHLIANSNGTFYARTSVTSVNFGNNSTIDYNGDVTEYQNNIRNLEEAVDGGTYDVSFKYGGFGTYVNEIVITKK